MKLFLVLLSVVLLLTQCSKDDEILKENNNALIVNKKWVVVENVSVDSLNRTTNLAQNLPEFQLDDYLLFNPDSTYELNDNNILRPDSVSKIIDAGKWELSSDGNNLLRESTVYNSTYSPATIREISENTLYLETYSASDRSYIRTRYRKSE